MDKHELRDMYIAETGNPFPDDVAKYADWLEEKFTSANNSIAEIAEQLQTFANVPDKGDRCRIPVELVKQWAQQLRKT